MTAFVCLFGSPEALEVLKHESFHAVINRLCHAFIPTLFTKSRQKMRKNPKVDIMVIYYMGSDDTGMASLEDACQRPAVIVCKLFLADHTSLVEFLLRKT